MKTQPLKKLNILWIFLLMIAIVGVQDVNAQKKSKKKKKGDKKEVVASKPKPKGKTIASLTKSSKKIEGLFTIYQDTITGSVKLLVKDDQLNKDFIYFSQIADGVTEAGAYRGSYRGSSVFHIRNYYNRIEFVAPNTAFYFEIALLLSK